MSGEDVLFPEEEETAEDFVEDQTNIETDEIKEEIEAINERLDQLENAVLPSIRKVMTDNGPRYIVEKSASRWYKPETLKAKLHGGDE